MVSSTFPFRSVSFSVSIPHPGTSGSHTGCYADDSSVLMR